jgi:hypothetical protein
MRKIMIVLGILWDLLGICIFIITNNSVALLQASAYSLGLFIAMLIIRES